MKTNDKGHFIFSGHSTIDLAKEFGTPIYVLSEDIIRKNANEIIMEFDKYNIDYKVVYAGKALLNLSMCKIINSLNMGLDVVSEGELYTAEKALFPMENIFFHGNNKSIQELERAIDLKVGRIIVDNIYELHLINTLSLERNIKTKVILRIKPNIDTNTHKHIQTGQEDSKFGISIEEAIDIFNNVKNMEGIQMKGIHCHIGSQLMENKSYKLAASTMMNLIAKIKKEYNFTIDELNLGGGFGIAYLDKEESINIEDLVQEIVKTIKDKAYEHKISIPKTIVEPGRYIVGNAGITLYEIGAIKDIPGVRKYISVNGGMADNPRTALYNAKYDAYVANKMNVEEKEIVSIAGKCCESGDMLIWDISLPSCEPGDILAVLRTGAYNYSMASNYNRLLKPPVILLNGDKAGIMVEGESLEDIISKDRIPKWLK